MLSPSVINKDHSRPEITVWLDDDTKEVKKRFRCTVCGQIVFEYYDSVRILIVGAVGYEHAPIVTQCKGKVDIETPESMITKTCKTMYYITRR